MSASGERDQIAAALDLAAASYGAGQLDAAAELYRWVEKRHPEDIRPLYSLALIDLRRRRFESARRRLKAVLRRQPDHFAATHNLGVVEQSTGAWALAADAYRRALALRPEAAESRFCLAITEAVLGRVEEAIDHYRGLAVEPAYKARALSRMAILRPTAVSDEELASLEAIAQAADSGHLRVEALFALGGAMEARGDYEAAWRAFETGNRLKRQSLERGVETGCPTMVDRAQAKAVARMKTIYTAEFLAANASQGDPASRPIFILGMPRSGSSLIEQILSGHARIRGMGESDCFAAATANDDPDDAPTQKLFPFRRMARDYLERQVKRGWDGRSRLVDKTLDNHLQAGLIHLMFPRATILVARRDPLDVGLACFRQLFAAGNETLYSLTDIAAEIRRYDDVIDHWGAVLPGRLFEVPYESLVAEPETQIRRLVTEGCGLPWSEACLHFHTTTSIVATASADQARRPVFTSSVSRWRRYAARLDPLRDGLLSTVAGPA